jgi:hypothetical protein
VFEVLSQRADAAREGDRTDEAIDLYKQALAAKSYWTGGWWYLATLVDEINRYAKHAPCSRNSSSHKSKV